jgi:hypothetical protein
MNIDWDGKGLPPVGTTVEVLWSSVTPSYVSCIVLAHDQGRALYRFTSGDRKGEYQAESYQTIQGSPNFRRLKTVEELAAEQRTMAIDELVKVTCINRGEAARIYDAGYRKFEIVEEDV